MYLLDEKYYDLIKLPQELYHHIAGIYTPEDCGFFAAADEDGVIPKGSFSDTELASAYRRGVLNKKKTETDTVYCVADFYSRMECVIEEELSLFRSLKSEDYLLIQKHMMSPAIWLEPRLKAESKSSDGIEGVMPLEVARKHYQEAKDVFYIAHCNCNAYMDRCKSRDKSRVCIHCFEGELPINTIYDRRLVASVSKEEAIKQLEYADAVGLVHSVHVSPRGVGTCNCCTCCCFQFSHYKEYDIKGSFLKTNYVIEVNEDLCVNCLSCAERCPFEALQSNEEKMTVDTEKCWGCGLCRNACPTDALVIRKR
ncbi:MAG: hypothetical protein CVU91_05555 [Firmicutes bacterium HGW-Firmicutes-16]|nr:MAG: hypothetical protein CVU91_05555 [Firmicutes bacterium HGW-Firmicutes-16]